MVRSRENLTGAYAFVIGIVLSVILGIFNSSLESAGELFYSILLVIGLVVGYFSVEDKNVNTFLFASLALVVVAGMGISPLLYVAKQNAVVEALRNVLASLMVLFVPATIVVTIKTIFAITRI